jgi:hypothetical protein
MQFLLLLPELPHAHDRWLLDRDVNECRSRAVRGAWTLVLSATAAAWRRLGVRHPWSDLNMLLNPRLL